MFPSIITTSMDALLVSTIFPGGVGRFRASFHAFPCLLTSLEKQNWLHRGLFGTRTIWLGDLNSLHTSLQLHQCFWKGTGPFLVFKTTALKFKIQSKISYGPARQEHKNGDTTLWSPPQLSILKHLHPCSSLCHAWGLVRTWNRTRLSLSVRLCQWNSIDGRAYTAQQYW